MANTYTQCKCGAPMRTIAQRCRKCWRGEVSLLMKGENNPNIGKKCSEEKKLKISQANKKHFQDGTGWGFKKGYTPWNKGTKGLCPWKPERRKKMLDYLKSSGGGMKGKKHKLETRRFLSESMQKEKCYNWQGGITYLNKIAYRHNVDWKIWWEECAKRDNYTCRVCLERGGRLQVHHIKKWSKYPDLRYDVSNGITLCVECHKLTLGKEIKLEQFFQDLQNNLKLGELLETPVKHLLLEKVKM